MCIRDRVFGHGMHDQVDAVFQWAREARRAKRAVGHADDAACLAQRCYLGQIVQVQAGVGAVSYTHLRAHETVLDLVCRLLLEKKKKKKTDLYRFFTKQAQAHTVAENYTY